MAPSYWVRRRTQLPKHSGRIHGTPAKRTQATTSPNLAYTCRSPRRFNSPHSPRFIRHSLSPRAGYHKLVDHVWIRWKKEYLLELRALHLYPSHPSSSLQVDDVVLIEEPNMSRGIWPLGRVVDVFFGQDGIIQACRVKAQVGKFIRRPVQKLYKLELDNATGGWEYVEKEE
ncbi:hypothetical protein HPB49_003704 [Dermacentor silvarum]|uniref:Uncharacterized protein n=1 Tax=Dermacentor silvarum TaxID=543639 RepID=A0ACB8DTR3_DERSI|nr:hypothetical protein HPB49_003704 [Dermacentor silvarum]